MTPSRAAQAAQGEQASTFGSVAGPRGPCRVRVRVRVRVEVAARGGETTRALHRSKGWACVAEAGESDWCYKAAKGAVGAPPLVPSLPSRI